MKRIKKNTIVNVEYTKGDGSTTDRSLFVVATPSSVYKAYDLSSINDEVLKNTITDSLVEYSEYVKQHRETLFTFEDFYEQSTGTPLPENVGMLKSFSSSGIKFPE